jgi:hypothetical protein
MKKILKYKGLILFYLTIAIITYGLTLRTEALNNNDNHNQKEAVVINLWN